MEQAADKLISLQAMLSGSNEFGITNALWTALEDCIEAPRKIGDILARLYEDAKSATSEIDKAYIEWKIETLDKRIALGAKEARRRYNLIRSLNTPLKMTAELEKCRQDTLYWFRNWAWTVDQRENLMPTMPFILFEFQEEVIEWWEDLVFVKSADGYLDKSRDQGVSWLVTAWSIKNFLFANRFDALFGSRTEDLVDSSGRLDSLFEKMRFQLRMLPEWMLPQGFDWTRDSNFKRIVNPETGTALVGEAPTTNFARSGRYLYAVPDELAFWPHNGYQAWGAMSQSSRSKLVITTPAGMNNQAADLRFKSDVSIKSIHWKRHPWKDGRWYSFQAKTMSREMRAQELDLDYEAAQAGRIFPMFDEVRSVITKSEFKRKFGLTAQDESGNFKIPDSWYRGMAMDVGSTLEHRCVSLWAARPAEGYPLRDCVFIYRQYMPEPGTTPRQIAKMIRLLEASWREYDKVNAMRLMSHEAKSERDTFIVEHALPFEAWETDYNAGVSQLQNYMEVRRTIAHPFHLGMDGAPRLFLIVDDEQGEITPRLQADGTILYSIIEATDDRGMARLRAEIPRYHYPVVEQGKEVSKRRPYKLFDDAVDALRALAAQFFPQSAEVDARIKLEKSLAVELQAENIIKARENGLTDAQLSNLILSREIFLKSKEREELPKANQDWRSRYHAEQGSYE